MLRPVNAWLPPAFRITFSVIAPRGFIPRRFFAVTSPMSYWADKVAVITGGSGGLGKALAAALAHRGMRIVLAARHVEAL
jgi:hypothetical protein